MKVVLKCIVEFIGKKQAPKNRQKSTEMFCPTQLCDMFVYFKNLFLYMLKGMTIG